MTSHDYRLLAYSTGSEASFDMEEQTLVLPQKGKQVRVNGRKESSVTQQTVLRFRRDCIEWSSSEDSTQSASTSLPWMDVIGAKAVDNYVVISTLIREDDLKKLNSAPKKQRSQKKAQSAKTPMKYTSKIKKEQEDGAKRNHKEFCFRCDEATVAEQAIRKVKEFALGTAEPHTRKFKIILNPHGGSGDAKKILTKSVGPLLSDADVSMDVCETQYAGHASDMGKSVDYESIEGILFISGDGTVQQFLQGILSRPDWRFIISQVPIASLGSGTQNALSVGIKTNRPEDVVHALLKCRLRSLDAILVTNAAGKSMISVCGVGWGIPGDIAASSEDCRIMFRKLRCSGTLRYCLLKCTKGFCCRQKHPAHLAYTTQPIRPVLAVGERPVVTESERITEIASVESKDQHNHGEQVCCVSPLVDMLNNSDVEQSDGREKEPLASSLDEDRTSLVTQLRRNKNAYISYQLDYTRPTQWETIAPEPKCSCCRGQKAVSTSDTYGTTSPHGPISQYSETLEAEHESKDYSVDKRSRGQTFTDGGLLNILMNSRDKKLVEHHNQVEERMSSLVRRQEVEWDAVTAYRLSTRAKDTNERSTAAATHIELEDDIEQGVIGDDKGTDTAWRYEEDKYLTVGGLNTAQEGFAVHPSDGYLDLIIAREGSLASILGLAGRYICGMEYGSDLMDYKKATAVVVEPVHHTEGRARAATHADDVLPEDRRDAVNIDGEVLFGPGPFVIQVLPALLTAYGEPIEYRHSIPPRYKLVHDDDNVG